MDINETLSIAALADEAVRTRLLAASQRARAIAETAQQPIDESAALENDSLPESIAEGIESTSEDAIANEQAVIQKLQARDRQVRMHEEAHRAAAGELYRGGPYYDYVTGPDGQRYAVSGSVQIDTSPGATPEETLRKAQRVQRSAMAPVDPSSTDRAVAASAARMEADARQSLLEDQHAERARNDAEDAPAADASPSQPQAPASDGSSGGIDVTA